jgi:hypothetical protein
VGTLEPSIAIRTCEDALRQLMSFVYRQSYGEGWLGHISNSDQRRTWAHRYEQEKEKRTNKGVALVPNEGLAYSDLGDLLKFVDRYWQPLEPALTDKSETVALLTRLEALRNTAMHSRTPLAFEEDLISGIAGQIRNQVTLYMSTQDATGQYFPRIESIIDSLGHRFDGPLEVVIGVSTVNTGKTLHPGDEIRFTCVGIDPQGRQLEFEFWPRLNAVDKKEIRVSNSGQPVTLQWHITEDDVHLQAQPWIHMRVANVRFHRFGDNDQSVIFTYRVLPTSI